MSFAEAASPRPARGASRRQVPPPATTALFLVTGVSALLYQVLWQRELGLVFGNGGHATAATLAAFFLGLALGGAWWGRRAPRTASPLRAFGGLELGIALLALAALGVVPLHRDVLVPALGLLDAPAGVRVLVKLGLAFLVVTAPAFLMGGTFPMLGEHSVRSGRALPGAGSALYAVNILGAALGALAAGFVLPQALGYRGAYAVAVVLGAAAGAIALFRGRGEPAASGDRGAPPPTLAGPSPEAGPAVFARLRVPAVAFWSGTATIAIEVLLTRMFMQTLQNSVYTFAALLAVFLLSLAVGAAGAHLLARTALRPARVLPWLLAACGAACAFAPDLFVLAVPRPGSVGAGEGFASYAVEVIARVAAVAFPLGLVLGLTFPFLAAVEQERDPDRARRAPGAVLGSLVSVNTFGGLVGALLGGFVLPALLGTWRSTAALGAGYLLLAFAPGRDRRALVRNCAVALALGLLVTGTAGRRDAETRWSLRAGEETVETYEGGAGSVAVVKVGGELELRLNQAYTLGGSGTPRWEELQSHVPLCLHPEPRRVCFLGLGTGITAGAALWHPVEHGVVAEIVPEVVTAARRHFAPWCHGLFESPAVEIFPEDARLVLAARPERFDVIVGDLFVPWELGTALLFTVEHFERVRERLAPGGVFAQWLPLYQLGPEDFLSVVRSFLAVFPRGALLRGDFFAERPIVALVARPDGGALDATRVVARWRDLQSRGALEEHEPADALPFLLYAGALRADAGPWEHARLSTDDRPWVEFGAPRAERERAAGRARPFTGSLLLELERQLLATTPPETDPWWSSASPEQHRLIHGGTALRAFAVADARGHAGLDARRTAHEELLRLVPERQLPKISVWVR